MDNDYIATLNYEEKLIFIKLFCKMIKADGVIEASELDFLNVIAKHLALKKQLL